MTMTERKKKWLVRMLLLFLCLAELFLGWYYGRQKKYLMCDELFTYTSSNNAEIQAFDMPLNEWLDKAWFLSQATVTEGHAFDYSIPYRNQEADVHPPFYYFLMHTLSSLVPGKLSIAAGVALNLVFLLGSTLLLYLVTKETFESRKTGVLVSVAFGLSYGAMNMLLFIRMYTMFSFWLLLHVYIYQHFVEKGKLGWKTLLYLGVTLVCGVLTHYYFILPAGFLALWYFGKFWITKRWKEACQYHVVLELSALAALVLFPAMWKHIFSDYRGEGARKNLVALAGFGGKLKTMTKIVSDELFGGWLPLLVAVGVVLLLLYLLKKKSFPWKELRRLYPLAFMTLGYFLMVTKIAPYQTDRYLMPIYAFAYLIGVGGFLWLLEKWMNQRRAFALAAVLFLGLNFFKLSKGAPAYAYSGFQEHQALAEEYKDTYCVYIDREYNWWEYYGVVQLLQEYKGFYCISYAAITEDIPAAMEKFGDADQVIVYVGDSELNEEITDYIRETVGAVEMQPLDEFDRYHIYLAKLR